MKPPLSAPETEEFLAMPGTIYVTSVDRANNAAEACHTLLKVFEKWETISLDALENVTGRRYPDGEQAKPFPEYEPTAVRKTITS